ncbi:MAG: Nif3-like dinuclear metal center hexameric protein [Acidimicrobiia bacterium]
MPTVAQIASRIAERTQPENTPDWDPVGLQLGDATDGVGSVGVCHEVTDEVLARLVETPVDLLVTYHPLLFNPINRLLAGRSAAARAYRLITAGVNLLVTHTDFDASPGGTADSLAAFLGLQDLLAFGADPETGLGAIGRYGSFAGTLGTIDAMLSNEFGPIGIRITGDREAEAGVVAVVPGSGSGFIEAAAEVAQVLVTGDVPHHRCVTARDLGLSVADPGHIATERPGMQALVELVAEASGLDVVDLTGVDPQTWD